MIMKKYTDKKREKYLRSETVSSLKRKSLRERVKKVCRLCHDRLTGDERVERVKLQWIRTGFGNSFKDVGQNIDNA